MADSVVDLGAAAVEGIGDFFSDAFDYMTGASEASASEGYFINKNRRAQTYVGGERPKGQTFREYLGFEDGGVAIPQEDMDRFVEFIQLNRPSYTEGETTEYRDFPILGMTPVQSPPKDIGPATGRGQGIGDLDFYEGFADPQFPIRPIEKQRFEQKRGFQMGTKIKLNDRDDAVGGKLLKQAGVQASAAQVLDNLDPKVLSQMSRILGRNIG